MSLHRDYKDACEKVNQSCYGLEGDAHTSFFEHIYSVCKWYDQMNPVFGSKPLSFALYTNEMEDGMEYDNVSNQDNEDQGIDDTLFHSDKEHNNDSDDSITKTY